LPSEPRRPRGTRPATPPDDTPLSQLPAAAHHARAGGPRRVSIARATLARRFPSWPGFPSHAQISSFPAPAARSPGRVPPRGVRNPPLVPTLRPNRGVRGGAGPIPAAARSFCPAKVRVWAIFGLVARRAPRRAGRCSGAALPGRRRTASRTAHGEIQPALTPLQQASRAGACSPASSGPAEPASWRCSAAGRRRQQAAAAGRRAVETRRWLEQAVRSSAGGPLPPAASTPGPLTATKGFPRPRGDHCRPGAPRGSRGRGNCGHFSASVMGRLDLGDRHRRPAIAPAPVQLRRAGRSRL